MTLFERKQTKLLFQHKIKQTRRQKKFFKQVNFGKDMKEDLNYSRRKGIFKMTNIASHPTQSLLKNKSKTGTKET